MILTSHKLNYLFVFLFSLLLVNCSPKDHDALIILDFDKAKSNSRKISLSEIGNKIRYIQLESTDSTIITEVFQIKIINNYILVNDNRKRILVFDLSGNLYSIIGARGRGPGEFIRVKDFDVDQSTYKIYIYDNEMNSILSYSIDGCFISSMDCEQRFTKLAYYKDLLICYYEWPYNINNHNYSINIINSFGEEKLLLNRAWQPLNKGIGLGYVPMSSRISLQKFNQSLLIWEMRFDTIYSYSTSSGLTPKYVIRCNNKIPFDEFSGNKILKEYCFPGFFIESNDCVFFVEGFYEKSFDVYYSKKEKTIFNLFFSDTNHYYNSRLRGFNNNIDGGMPFAPNGITSSGKLFSYFYVHDLARILLKPYQEYSVVELSSEVKSLLENYNIEDNPVIMILD